MAFSGSVARHVVLTGSPGVGKTTLVHKTCEALKKSGIPVQGFYTEELRAGGRRTGFDVVTLDGKRGPLARVSQDAGSSGGREYRVGQYAVQLQAFEQVALPVLRKQAISGNSPVFVIDEVGKMEMFSPSFIQAVKALLSDPHVTVLVTIPIAKGRPIPLVEEIRKRTDAQLCTLSKENRNAALDDVVRSVSASHKQFSCR